MRHVLLSMAAISALASGAPAAAQYANGGYQNPNGNYQNQSGNYQNQNGGYANGNMSARIAQLQTRIQAGVQSGAISRSEAMPLRQQLRDLTRLERQYSVNGLTGQERSDLQQRLRNLRQQVRVADGGANGRYDQYERDEGYGQNGHYGGNGQYGQNGQYDRVDRDNDGFDDRDYNRNGRWDDDSNNGQYDNGQYDNGQYEQPAQRGGLGGIVDRVLGTGGLRVGQRVSGNLSAVPSEYRNQYRDDNNVYYRSDGRQIYQIDARTETVVRVYSMNR